MNRRKTALRPLGDSCMISAPSGPGTMLLPSRETLQHLLGSCAWENVIFNGHSITPPSGKTGKQLETKNHLTVSLNARDLSKAHWDWGRT